MNGDYLDYLAHYRTPGSLNGVSHTPGYDAVGKKAMTEAEKRAARKARRKEIRGAKNYDNSEARKTNKSLQQQYTADRELYGKSAANQIQYVRDKYGKAAASKFRKQTRNRQIAGGLALVGGIIAAGTLSRYIAYNP